MNRAAGNAVNIAARVVVASLMGTGWALAQAGGMPPASVQLHPEAVSWFAHDWMLLCDNTRTCRAMGYQAENSTSEPVSMRITRAAGLGAPVQVHLQIHSQAQRDVGAALKLVIGSQEIYPVNESDALSPAQTEVLLSELAWASHLLIQDSEKTWVLSLQGAREVLARMDAVQGWQGRASALAVVTPWTTQRRGEQRSETVPPALNAPVLQAVLPPTRAQWTLPPLDEVLANWQLKADDARVVRACQNLTQTSRSTAFQISPQALQPLAWASFASLFPLTAQRSLLAVECVRAYNERTGLYWIVEHATPAEPHRTQAQGLYDPDTGRIQWTRKLRTRGDCLWTREWLFNGHDFVLAQEMSDLMCRGFVAGTWSAPSYVSTTSDPHQQHPMDED